MKKEIPASLRAQTLWWSACVLALLLWLTLIAALLLSHFRTPLLMNMFPGGPFMDDLLTYTTRIPLLGTPGFYVPHLTPPTFAYPPAAAYLLRLLFHLPYRRVFLLLCVLAAGVYSYMLFRLLKPWIPSFGQRLALSLSLPLLMYPLAFTLERGNVEIFIALLVAGGMFSLWRDKPLLAAVLLGLAATIKPFPVLLLGVFLTRRVQWRPLLLAAATIIVTTLLCLWRAGPTVFAAARGFYNGIANIEHSRAATTYDGGLMFDHSFFSPVKVIALSEHIPVKPLLEVYYVVLVAVLLWGAWRVSRSSLLNRICFYSVAAVAASPISYQYTIVQCYPLLLFTMAQFCAVERHRQLGKFELCVLGCMLLLFLPFTLYGNGRVVFGGQIEAVLLGLLLLGSLVRPWSGQVVVPVRG